MITISQNIVKQIPALARKIVKTFKTRTELLEELIGYVDLGERKIRVLVDEVSNFKGKIDKDEIANFSWYKDNPERDFINIFRPIMKSPSPLMDIQHALCHEISHALDHRGRHEGKSSGMYKRRDGSWSFPLCEFDAEMANRFFATLSNSEATKNLSISYTPVQYLSYNKYNIKKNIKGM